MQKDDARLGGLFRFNSCNKLGVIHGKYDGFEYELENGELGDYPGIFTSSVVWGPSVIGSARELLTAAEKLEGSTKESILSEAMIFLSKILTNGPMPMRSIEDQASGDGYSMATIKRAKRSLGVISFKETGNIGEREKAGFGSYLKNMILSMKILKKNH